MKFPFMGCFSNRMDHSAEKKETGLRIGMTIRWTTVRKSDSHDYGAEQQCGERKT